MPILAHIPYVIDIDKKKRPQYVTDYVNEYVKIHPKGREKHG